MIGCVILLAALVGPALGLPSSPSHWRVSGGKQCDVVSGLSCHGYAHGSRCFRNGILGSSHDHCASGCQRASGRCDSPIVTSVTTTRPTTTPRLPEPEPEPTPCSTLDNPYEAVNGRTFGYACNSAYSVAADTIIASARASSFRSCLDTCSTFSDCIAVNFALVVNANQNNCQLLSRHAFALAAQVGVIAATVTNDPPPPVSCSTLDNPYEAANSKVFPYTCDNAWITTPAIIISLMATGNLQACIDACSLEATCVGTNFNLGSSPGSPYCGLLSSTALGSEDTPGSVASFLNTTAPPKPCSDLDNPYEAPNGVPFDYSCNTVFTSTAANFIDELPTADLQECIDSCSINTDCIAINFSLDPSADTNCQHLSSASVEDGPAANFIAASRPEPPPITCGTLPNPYEATSGLEFEYLCDSAYSELGGLTDSLFFNTVERCIEFCASTSDCYAFNFLLGSDGATDNCILLASRGNGPSTQLGVIAFRKVIPPCGQVANPYQTSNGNQFSYECDKTYSSAAFLDGQYPGSLEGCMEACSANLECLAVDYIPTIGLCQLLAGASGPLYDYTGLVAARLILPF